MPNTTSQLSYGERLYDDLRNAGFTESQIGSEERFLSAVKDPTIRRNIYNNVNKAIRAREDEQDGYDGYRLPDYATYEALLEGKDVDDGAPSISWDNGGTIIKHEGTDLFADDPVAQNMRREEEERKKQEEQEAVARDIFGHGFTQDSGTQEKGYNPLALSAENISIGGRRVPLSEQHTGWRYPQAEPQPQPQAPIPTNADEWMQQRIAAEEAYEAEEARRNAMVNPDLEGTGIGMTVGQQEDLVRNSAASLADFLSKGPLPDIIGDIGKQADAAVNDVWTSYAQANANNPYAANQGMLAYTHQRANLAANDVEQDAMRSALMAQAVGGYTSLLSSVLDNEGMQRTIADEARRAGVDKEWYETQVLAALNEAFVSQLQEALVRKQMPQNTIEYIMSGVQNSIIGGAFARLSMSQEQWNARQEAVALYEVENDPSAWYKGAKMGVGFAVDAPLFAVAGAGAGAVTARVVSPITRTAIIRMAGSKVAGKSAAAVERATQAFLNSRFGARVASQIPTAMVQGGGTLGTYNALSTAAQQAYAGYFDFGEIASSAAEGFGMGATMGITGPLAGELSAKVLGSATATTTKVGRVFKAAAGEAIKVGGETAGFTAAEEIAGLVSGEQQPLPLDEAVANSFATVIALKLTNLPGLRELRRSYDYAFHPKEYDADNYKGPSFDRRERESLRKHFGEGGFFDCLMKMETWLSRDMSRGERARLADPDYAAARGELEAAYRAMMDDPEIDFLTKQKLAVVAGGVLKVKMPAAARMDATWSDGRGEVILRDKDGMRIETREFTSEKDYDRYVKEAQRVVDDETAAAAATIKWEPTAWNMTYMDMRRRGMSYEEIMSSQERIGRYVEALAARRHLSADRAMFTAVTEVEKEPEEFKDKRSKSKRLRQSVKSKDVRRRAELAEQQAELVAAYRALTAADRAVMYRWADYTVEREARIYSEMAARAEGIVARQNKDMGGAVVYGTLRGGGKVLVLSGKVAQKSDGAIDYDGSDDTFVVANEDGSGARFVSKKDLATVDRRVSAVDAFGEAQRAVEQQVDEQMEREAAAPVAEEQPIEEAVATAGAEERNTPFARNQNLILVDDEGNEHRVRIIDEDDGTWTVYDVDADTETDLSTEDLSRRVKEGATWGDTEEQPAVVEEQPVEQPTTIAAEPTETTAEPTEGVSALSLIPKGADGTPDYEAVAPAQAWDGLMERAGGDRGVAGAVASDMLADKQDELQAAQKAAGKAEAAAGDEAIRAATKGKGVEEKMRYRQEVAARLAAAREAVDSARRSVEFWRAVAEEPSRRAAAVEKRQPTSVDPTLAGVPDVSNDSYGAARERGFIRADGHRVDRQGEQPFVGGATISVKFGKDEAAEGQVGLMEADGVQPSHINGQNNRVHYFLDDGQPKQDREQGIRQEHAREISTAVDPKQVTGTVDAYHGSPVVNARGEVIQGNNRTVALRDMLDAHARSWDRVQQLLRDHAADCGLSEEDVARLFTTEATNNKERDAAQRRQREALARYGEEYGLSSEEVLRTLAGEKYRQYLRDHAADYSLSVEDIDKMSKPLLVVRLDIPDSEAVRLGQFTSANLETGGRMSIDAGSTLRKMSADDIKTFAKMLLATDDPEASLADMIREKGQHVLGWLLNRGFIDAQQYAGTFKEGSKDLGDVGVKALRDLLEFTIFDGTSKDFRTKFNALPDKARKALLATICRDFASPADGRILPEVQRAIEAYYALLKDSNFAEAFKNAKNYEALREVVYRWLNSPHFDDITGEPVFPQYSSFALRLMELMKLEKQTTLRKALDLFFDDIQGIGKDLLFGDEVVDSSIPRLIDDYRKWRNGEQRETTDSVADAVSDGGRRGGAGVPSSGGGVPRGEQSPVVRGGDVSGVEGVSTGAEGAAAEPTASAEVAAEKPTAVRGDHRQIKNSRQAYDFLRKYDGCTLESGKNNRHTIRLRPDGSVDITSVMGDEFVPSEGSPKTNNYRGRELTDVAQMIQEETNWNRWRVVDRPAEQAEKPFAAGDDDKTVIAKANKSGQMFVREHTNKDGTKTVSVYSGFEQKKGRKTVLVARHTVTYDSDGNVLNDEVKTERRSAEQAAALLRDDGVRVVSAAVREQYPAAFGAAAEARDARGVAVGDVIYGKDGRRWVVRELLPDGGYFAVPEGEMDLAKGAALSADSIDFARSGKAEGAEGSLFHREETTGEETTSEQGAEGEAEDREVNARRARVEAMLSSLEQRFHYPVHRVYSLEEVTDRRARAALERDAAAGTRDTKAWYDPTTGEVVVYMPHCDDAADAARSVLHEVKSHAGLRAVLGDSFASTMERICRGLPAEVREAVERAAAEDYGGNIATATEEYISSLAEDDAARPRWWSRVLSELRSALRSLGFDVSFSDDDLNYLLWKAEDRLAEGDLYQRAEDIARRQELARGRKQAREEGKEKRVTTTPTSTPRSASEEGKPASSSNSNGKGSNNSETAKGNGGEKNSERRRRAGERAVETLKKRGVDVVVDADEMQRVLDEIKEGRERSGSPQYFWLNEREGGRTRIGADRRTGEKRYIDFTRPDSRKVGRAFEAAWEEFHSQHPDIKITSWGEGEYSFSQYPVIKFPNGSEVRIRISDHTKGMTEEELDNDTSNGIRWCPIYKYHGMGNPRTIEGVGAYIDISHNRMGAEDLMQFIEKMSEYDRDGFPEGLLELADAGEKEMLQKTGISVPAIYFEDPRILQSFGMDIAPVEGTKERKLRLANYRFNKELADFDDYAIIKRSNGDEDIANGMFAGKPAKEHIFQLGMPSDELLSAGVQDLPLELSASTLIEKSSEGYKNNHPFAIGSIKDLPTALAHPIAVFKSAKKGDNGIVILTDLKEGDDNFVVIVRRHNNVNDIEVNSVRSLYPKDSKIGIIKWVENGLLEGVDKKKFSGYLSTQWPDYIASQGIKPEIRKRLISAAKIVEDFDSTKSFGENVDKNDPQYLKTPDGEIYGFAYKGKVYLDPSVLDANTPVHEYTHLFDEALQKDNPTLWKQGIELLKQTPLWEQVKGMEQYKDIADDENKLASEVHSRLSGAEGQRYFEQLQDEIDRTDGVLEKAEKVDLLYRLRDWLDKAMRWVKDKVFGKDAMSLEEFVNMPLSDLLDGRSGEDWRDRRYTLSEKKVDGRRFYQDEEGNIDLATIPKDVCEALGIEPLPFRVTRDEGYHAYSGHSREVGAHNPSEMVAFAVNVMENFDHVRKGDGEHSYIFSIEDGRDRVGQRAVTLVVDSEGGGYLRLKTSGNERMGRLKRRELLWEKSEPSTTGTVPANVTSDIARQDGGLRSNASNQSVSSEGKGRENIGGVQGKGGEGGVRSGGIGGDGQNGGVGIGGESGVRSEESGGLVPVEGTESAVFRSTRAALAWRKKEEDKARAVREKGAAKAEVSARQRALRAVSKTGGVLEALRGGASEAHKDMTVAYRDAVASVGTSLQSLRQAMTMQKDYDRESVGAIVRLVQDMEKAGLLRDLSPSDHGMIERAIRDAVGNINNGSGDAHFASSVDTLFDVLTRNQLRASQGLWDDLLSTKASTTRSGGGVALPTVGDRGRAALETLGSYLNDGHTGLREGVTLDDIGTALSGCEEAIIDGRARGADVSAQEGRYAALSLLQDYCKEVLGKRAAEVAIDREIDDVRQSLEGGDIDKATADATIAELERARRDSQLSRAVSLQDMSRQLRAILDESRGELSSWRQKELEHKGEIYHAANRDMQRRHGGRVSDDPNKGQTWVQKLSNTTVPQFFSSAMSTFNTMLRFFGYSDPTGDGALHSLFMSELTEGRERAFTSWRSAIDRLNAKTEEIYGNGVKYNDLLTRSRRGTLKVEMYSGTDVRDEEGRVQKVEKSLSEGNALYIYAVNKMADGKMKLRRMGITEEDVARLADALDPKAIAMMDWIQEEFLPSLRKEYNETHKAVFGGSMDEIENYMPIRINRASLPTEEELVDIGNGVRLPAVMTGAVVRRTTNTLPIDVFTSDAFSVIADHVREMSHWSGLARFNKDLCTLLSDKRFQTQVKNMTTVMGSGDVLWDRFRTACLIAADEYHGGGSRGSVDRLVTNMAHGATAAQITFRLFTAFKQVASIFAGIHNCRMDDLLWSMGNLAGSCRWAMANLPGYRERWESRMAGDTRLLPTEDDWSLWRWHIVNKCQRVGMAPNAGVDCYAVAAMARGVYRSRYRQYRGEGFSQEVARRKALEAATVAYNETQQSAVGAYNAQMQKDNTLAAVALSTFHNASFGYGRGAATALVNLSRMCRDGYREQAITSLSHRLEEEGLTDEQARAAAEKRYRKAWGRNIVAVVNFAFFTPMLWSVCTNLPANIVRAALGGEDDEHSMARDGIKDALTYALCHTFDGLPLGKEIGDMAYSLVTEGKLFSNNDLLPFFEQLDVIKREIGGDRWQALHDTVGLLGMSVAGVDIKTLETMVQGVYDACSQDEFTARDAAMIVMAIANVPKSQRDKVYFDQLGLSAREAATLTPQEVAERYAINKAQREAGWTWWLRGDTSRAAAVERAMKGANSKARERAARYMSDDVRSRYNELWDDYLSLKKRVANKEELSAEERRRYDIGKAADKDLKALAKKWLQADEDSVVDEMAARMIERRGRFVDMMDNGVGAPDFTGLSGRKLGDAIKAYADSVEQRRTQDMAAARELVQNSRGNK